VAACPGPSDKKYEIRLAALNDEDFALMDLKMTRCSPNAPAFDQNDPRYQPGAADSPDRIPYVHLLALPRRHVTGVEDANAKELVELWPLAWTTAAAYMPESQILLAANPPGFRDQEQLHVHVMRLSDEKRTEFFEPSDGKRPRPAPVSDLKAVWKAAEEQAQRLAPNLGLEVKGEGGALRTGRFGVMVAKPASGDGWVVSVVADASAEKSFGLPCPDLGKKSCD
jgi:diadenosine tetraphosphate (Ap4A) HIT family hydrolase